MEENKDLKQDVPTDEPAEKEPAPAAEPPEQEEPKQEPKPAEDVTVAGNSQAPSKQEPLPPDLNAELKAANERADAAEARAEVLGMGVKADAVADVIALAKTRQSDKMPFKQAVNEVLTAYPQFRETPPITTGTRTTGDTQEDDAKVRAVMGLPPKNN